MFTLCIRYRLDPAKLADFDTYATAVRGPAERCGGRSVEYFAPTKLAGPTDVALGFIDFPDLQAYELYRHKLAEDPDATLAAENAAACGCILGEERSFLERIPASAETRGGPAALPSELADASPVERVYFAWDEALASNNVEGLLALYAADCRLESPVIPHLLGAQRGVIDGREELRPLLEKVAERKPPVRRYVRTPYLTDGRRLIWEYPRETADGDQMDFVESMEINAQGLIERHRVYWGWFGLGVLERDEYHSG